MRRIEAADLARSKHPKIQLAKMKARAIAVYGLSLNRRDGLMPSGTVHMRRYRQVDC
ncbi:MAG: hypothetical protein WB392_12795 [Methanotrichaceae archaeon]